MQSREQYEETYQKEIEKLPDQQIISLLVLNVRNHETNRRKYKNRKDKAEYLLNLVSNIDLLSQELMVRMDGGNKVSDIAKQVDKYLSEFDKPEAEISIKRGFYEVEDDEQFKKPVKNGTATIEIEVNGGARVEEEVK